MMHLTTNTAATATRPDPESTFAIDRHRCEHRSANVEAGCLSIRRESRFYSGMANLLEERRAGFHYSAIGRYAAISLTFGYTGIP
jgi:hypothetical protein